MRRVLVAITLLGLLVAGPVPHAVAAPPQPAGWQATGSTLTWTAARPVPIGDAVVEFYAGDRLLGRPRPAPDQRTFTLDVPDADDLVGLQVRAGGRRIDIAPPRTSSAGPAPVLPAPLPANPVDPGTKGSYRTVSGEYSLASVTLPDFPAPVEMRGLVVAPADAPGARPLALFLHGRHFTCYTGPGPDQISGDWPCPAGAQEVPSHRGYRQAQELLASQGYVTVSISANGINGQDFAATDAGTQARSSLVRLHLDRWADWAGAGRGSAPAIAQQAPPVDPAQIFLIGHSRGGEGVNRAALDSLAPPPDRLDGFTGSVRWTVRGTLLIGPTIFGHNPAPDVPSATILPGCDGDVSDLQGQIYVEATRGVSRGRALHSALLMIGANHNYFNTEWTPGQATGPASDDFYHVPDDPDPLCSPSAAGRLTPAQQQTAGATYIAAAARLFVGGDDQVRPLLDGSGFRAASADPARVLSQAVGGARTPVILPDESLTATNARVCPQVSADLTQACLRIPLAPQFTRFNPVTTELGRYAVTMKWSAPGTPVTLKPRQATAVAGDQALALRMFTAPNAAPATFSVAVTDSAGVRSALGDITVAGLPGTNRTTSYWGQEVRVPLTAGVTDVAQLELVPRSASGEAWLVDAWGWRPGTPAPQPVALPRVDIGQTSVQEGASGTRTYNIPVQVSGSGTGSLTLYLYDQATGTSVPRSVTVTPGTTEIRFPVQVTGNTLFGANRRELLQAKAVSGTSIGSYEGGLIVVNDDPLPALTLAPVTQPAAEGGKLTFRVTLATPAETWLHLYLAPLKPTQGTELSSTDVDPAWFTEVSGENPEPSRPLSGTAASPFTTVEPGRTTADIAVPLRADGVAEATETTRMQLVVYAADLSGGFQGPIATATVID